MTRDELKEIADEAAIRAVERTFLAMGINTSNADGLVDFQADMAHLRKWRRAVEQAERVGWGVVITTLVTGTLGAIWLGLKDMIHR